MTALAIDFSLARLGAAALVSALIILILFAFAWFW